MTRTIIASELVPLRGGLVVPLAAVLLLFDLERRGFDILVDADEGVVVCRPARLLTAKDKRALKAHREHLKRLISYCEVVQ